MWIFFFGFDVMCILFKINVETPKESHAKMNMFVSLKRAYQIDSASGGINW